jgi:hypothetical protein
MLVSILAPNLWKFFSTVANLPRWLPGCLRLALVKNPMTPEDAETRSRLRNAFTMIFVTTQTHLLNILVLALFLWIVPCWQMPVFSILVRSVLSIASMGGVLLNLIIVRYLVINYLNVQVVGRFYAEAYSQLKRPEPLPRVALTPIQTFKVWGALPFTLFQLLPVAASSISCGPDHLTRTLSRRAGGASSVFIVGEA